MAESNNLVTNNSHIFYKIISTEESTSIPNNSSVVRVRVKVWRDNNYETYGSGTCYVTCNGESKSAGITSSQVFSLNSNTEVFNQTFTIPHNADGTKTIYISSSISHERFSSNSQGFDVTLTPIPRASTVSSITGTTIGSNVVVNINRASNTFTHSVVLQFGNVSSTVSSATTSATFTPPLDWCRQVPTSTSGTATITVTTYNGSTNIGTTTKTFTLSVPDTVKPTAPTLDDKSDPTGVFQAMGNRFVQSKSKLKGTINSSGSYESTITSYKAVVNGTTYTTQTFTTSFLAIGGTNSCVITVTDSRGRTNSTTINFYVFPYTAPKITTFTAERDTTTPTTVNYSVDAEVTSIEGQNTKAYTLKYKKQSASSYTSISLDNSSPTLTTSGTVTSIDDNSSYNFVLQVTDYFSTTSSQIDLGTAFQLMNFAPSGQAMAIGGVYDNGIGGLLQIDGDTNVGGQIKRKFPSSFTTINKSNVLEIDGSTDGFKIDYEALVADNATTYLYTTDDATTKLSLGNEVGGTYKEAISIVNGSATVNGTATNVTQKKSATSVIPSGYGTNNDYVPDMSFIAYWNGAYNSNNSSNLRYFSKGLMQQNNTAYLNYGRKTYSSGTAWSNFDLSQPQNGATTGSGLIVNSNTIKINTTAINRVLVTASVEGFKNGSGTSDNAFSVLVSYNSFRRNILYASVPNANWHNGGSITFPVTVANGTTIKIQGTSGTANSSIEVLNADLFVQDITV